MTSGMAFGCWPICATRLAETCCAMLERPKSLERIQHSLAYTWRVATPAKRRWLRPTFADTGYDHRHLFDDQGDHDKHDEALELGREQISQARTTAQTLLTSRGYSAAEWADDRDPTLEQLPSPEGPRPTLVFHFTRRAGSRRWYRRASLTISVDLEDWRSLVGVGRLGRLGSCGPIPGVTAPFLLPLRSRTPADVYGLPQTQRDASGRLDTRNGNLV